MGLKVLCSDCGNQEPIAIQEGWDPQVVNYIRQIIGNIAVFLCYLKSARELNDVCTINILDVDPKTGIASRPAPIDSNIFLNNEKIEEKIQELIASA